MALTSSRETSAAELYRSSLGEPRLRGIIFKGRIELTTEGNCDRSASRGASAAARHVLPESTADREDRAAHHRLRRSGHSDPGLRQTRAGAAQSVRSGRPSVALEYGAERDHR